MTKIEDIVTQIRKSTGFRGEITQETTLQGDLELWGDDMDEVLGDYSERFNVDMSSYLWYFHTKEEGQNVGAAFSQPPNERVQQIPITLAMLCDFANQGKWSLPYPKHTLPKRRTDILVNQVLAGAVLILIIAWTVMKFMK